MPDNLNSRDYDGSNSEYILGFHRDRLRCAWPDCGEAADAWAVAQVGTLDPQAGTIVEVRVRFFCAEHFQKMEPGGLVKIDNPADKPQLN